MTNLLMCTLVHVGTLYLYLFHFFLVDNSLTKAERILNRIIEGDSNIDFSEDESHVSQIGEGENPGGATRRLSRCSGRCNREKHRAT